MPPAAAVAADTAAPPWQLTTVAARVESRLEQLFDDEMGRWKGLDWRLAEAIEELAAVVRSGGKRLRAAFCYWGWRGQAELAGAPGAGTGGPVGAGPVGLDDGAVIDVGSAFELLQAFALIHDDIMDDSATRRGRPTVHMSQARRLSEQGWRGEPRRFGEGVAILIGDLSHAYADQLMSGANPVARRIWDDLRIELNLGQYLDLRSAASGQLDRDTARQVSMFKSALYTIVRPLQLGAALALPPQEVARLSTGPGPLAPGAPGTRPGVMELLERYGRPLGRAFQLRDDLLGVLGDEQQVGKPVGDDLREGKPTELVALAMERADPAQLRLLGRIGERALSADDVAAIVAVLVGTGAVADIEARIAGLVAESVAALDELPFGSESRNALASLADYVAARNS